MLVSSCCLDCLSIFGIHQYSSYIMIQNLIFCHVCVYPQVSWLKDGRFISLRDRLYTQTKKQLRGNPQAQDKEARDDQLLATLFVASVRRDATFTCRIETNPPDEKSMPISVRGETVNFGSLVILHSHLYTHFYLNPVCQVFNQLSFVNLNTWACNLHVSSWTCPIQVYMFHYFQLVSSSIHNWSRTRHFFLGEFSLFNITYIKYLLIFSAGALIRFLFTRLLFLWCCKICWQLSHYSILSLLPTIIPFLESTCILLWDNLLIQTILYINRSQCKCLFPFSFIKVSLLAATLPKTGKE